MANRIWDALAKPPSKKAPIVIEITDPKKFESIGDEPDDREGLFSCEVLVQLYANFDEPNPYATLPVWCSSLWAEPLKAFEACHPARHSLNRLLELFGYKFIYYEVERLEETRKRKSKAKEKKSRAKAMREEAKALLEEAKAEYQY